MKLATSHLSPGLPELRKEWRILLDAAKLACSPGALDLKSCCADFTVVSFYKIFGYPTGLGALLVRHDAAPLLQPAEATYFAGVAQKVGVVLNV